MKIRLVAAAIAVCFVALLGWHLATQTPSGVARAAPGVVEFDAGSVHVIDGDTIEIPGEIPGETPGNGAGEAPGRIVQLFGIDAPELGQYCRRGEKLDHCGLHAAFALRKLLIASESPIVCTTGPGDGPGEVCRIGHEDVSVVMLHQGYAMALPDAFVDYQDAQASARNAGLGIWGGTMVPPKDWRAGVRLPGEEAKPCPIKGVVGEDGIRRYFVPTDRGYESLTLDRERGDRAFCSDEAARREGWIRPGQSAKP